MLKWLFRRGGARLPESAQDCFQLGSELAQRGRLKEAVVLLRRAVELEPSHAAAHHNLGSALRDRGERQAALAAYREAARLVPEFAEAHYGIGLMLIEERGYEEALASLLRAIALNPRLAEARFQAGNAQMGLGNWQAALGEFKAAIAARPDYAEARWARAMSHLPAVYGAGTDPAERRRTFATELKTLRKWLGSTGRPDAWLAVGVHQPFYLAYQEAPNRELLAEYGEVCAEQMGRWQSRAGLAPPAKRARAKPRIGIVSAHIYEHSVWTALVRGWVERLGARSELHIFHLGAGDDAETAFARKRAAQFHAGWRPFDQWAPLIHAAGLDLIIYPEIGMDATTAKLASMRLAPVQAASWGHPETTGLPTIDYYLSAQALEPADAQANYTEKLVALPNLGCSLLPGKEESGRFTGLEPGQDELLLVCPGTAFKYAPQHDRLLAEIARRVPSSRLVFFRSRPEALADKLRERLRDSFRRAGVDFERHVVFIPWQTRGAFRALLRRADLYLDTIGFSGFNTAVQALECGLPIVAREGRFLRGRLGSGPLRHLGLDELVAPSEEAYVELAAALAADPARRQALRRRIESARERLFRDQAPLDALEGFLKTVLA
ncbi:MAG TPA: tetratricopeptide repeat protein [Burkholderiales bacterium]|nr:tetratricopeptide repeat protein [Burkholderiales bacterium]